MKLKIPTLRHSEQEAQKIVGDLVARTFDDLRLPFSLRLKYFCEQVLSGFLLVILALPMLAIYLLVRLTSRGPGIFKQSRVGLGGNMFTMYKFRTMSLDAESKSGPAWSPGGSDPRLTKIGKGLRFLHLDELPQLLNVLKGEMSLIGPRPERPVFVLVLAEEVDDYLARLKVRPGITGLAQVYLEADVSIDCVRRKVLFDKFYIKRQCVALDFRIALCTLLRIVGFRGGRGPRWSGLNRYLVDCGFLRSVHSRSALSARSSASFEKESEPKFDFDLSQKRLLKVPAIASSARPKFTNSAEKTVSRAIRKPK